MSAVSRSIPTRVLRLAREEAPVVALPGQDLAPQGVVLRAFQQVGMENAGLGVDAENITGALRIYEQLGFYVVQRLLAYSKTV